MRAVQCLGGGQVVKTWRHRHPGRPHPENLPLYRLRRPQGAIAATRPAAADHSAAGLVPAGERSQPAMKIALPGTGFGQGPLAEGHGGGAALEEARARKQSIYVAYMCSLLA
jgi:hypothetical protein